MPAPLWSGGGGWGSGRGHGMLLAAGSRPVTAEASKGDYDDELPFKSHFKELAEWREKKMCLAFSSRSVPPRHIEIKSVFLFKSPGIVQFVFFMTAMTYLKLTVMPQCVFEHILVKSKVSITIWDRNSPVSQNSFCRITFTLTFMAILMNYFWYYTAKNV